MTKLVVDTSVAVALIVQTHAAHRNVMTWWGRRPIGLSGYAAIETYSVLTRLPGESRLTPGDAARILNSRFDTSVQLSAPSAAELPLLFGQLCIAGGAVYDALVAMAAKEHDAVLATRDLRARSTYELVGATVEFLPS